MTSSSISSSSVIISRTVLVHSYCFCVKLTINNNYYFYFLVHVGLVYLRILLYMRTCKVPPGFEEKTSLLTQ